MGFVKKVALNKRAATKADLLTAFAAGHDQAGGRVLALAARTLAARTLAARALNETSEAVRRNPMAVPVMNPQDGNLILYGKAPA